MEPEDISMLRRGDRVACSSLELTFRLSPQVCCTGTRSITMALSNDKISKMLLDFLERPLWSVLPLEATLLPVVHCPVPMVL